MSYIDHNEIQENYNNIDEIWTKEDSCVETHALGHTNA